MADEPALRKLPQVAQGGSTASIYRVSGVTTTLSITAPGHAAAQHPVPVDRRVEGDDSPRLTATKTCRLPILAIAIGRAWYAGGYASIFPRVSEDFEKTPVARRSRAGSRSRCSHGVINRHIRLWEDWISAAVSPAKPLQSPVCRTRPLPRNRGHCGCFPHTTGQTAQRRIHDAAAAAFLPATFFCAGAFLAALAGV